MAASPITSHAKPPPPPPCPNRNPPKRISANEFKLPLNMLLLRRLESISAVREQTPKSPSSCYGFHCGCAVPARRIPPAHAPPGRRARHYRPLVSTSSPLATTAPSKTTIPLCADSPRSSSGEWRVRMKRLRIARLDLPNFSLNASRLEPAPVAELNDRSGASPARSINSSSSRNPTRAPRRRSRRRCRQSPERPLREPSPKLAACGSRIFFRFATTSRVPAHPVRVVHLLLHGRKRRHPRNLPVAHLRELIVADKKSVLDGIHAAVDRALDVRHLPSMRERLFAEWLSPATTMLANLLRCHLRRGCDRSLLEVDNARSESS